MGEVLEFPSPGWPGRIMLRLMGLPDQARRRVEDAPFNPHYCAKDDARGLVLTAIPVLVTSERTGRVSVFQMAEGAYPVEPRTEDVMIAVLNGAVVQQAFKERQQSCNQVESWVIYANRLARTFVPTAQNYARALEHALDVMQERRKKRITTDRLAPLIVQRGLMTLER